MGLLETKGFSRIEKDKAWSDYKSLKEHYMGNVLDEFLYSGYHTSNGAAAEIQADTTTAMAFLAAEAIIYARSEADLAALDGDSIFIDYLDDDGVLHENVETLLNVAGGLGTDNEMPIGNENVLDTVAAVDTKTVTLTALAGTLNQYAGKYMVVYSGDQKGTSSLIVSNTAATPTVLTVTDNQNANLAADLISIQTAPYDDIYRIRQMSCETEAPTDNNIWLCDHDATNKYAVISDANTRAAIARYFVPAATTSKTKYFLAFLKARATIINEGDTTATGFIIQVRFTPKALNASIPAADILLQMEFNEFLNWEPCIELEPATDVQILLGDNGTAGEVLIEYCILELNRR